MLDLQAYIFPVQCWLRLADFPCPLHTEAVFICKSQVSSLFSILNPLSFRPIFDFLEDLFFNVRLLCDYLRWDGVSLSYTFVYLDGLNTSFSMLGCGIYSMILAYPSLTVDANFSEGCKEIAVFYRIEGLLIICVPYACRSSTVLICFLNQLVQGLQNDRLLSVPLGTLPALWADFHQEFF